MRKPRICQSSLSLAALLTLGVVGACSDDEGNQRASSAGTGGSGRGGSGRGDASAVTGGSSGAAGSGGTQGTAGSAGTQGAAGGTTTGGSGGNLDGGADSQAAGGATAGSAGSDASSGSGGGAGADGSVGSSGSLGSAGAMGAAGSTGNAGANGAAGARGNGGSNGAAGAAGNGGATGSAGAAGKGGSAGSAGSAGKGGTAGTAGASGTGGKSGTGGTAGTAGASGSAGAGGSGGGTTCMAGELLSRLGKNRMLVGGAMSDATAKAAPFDVRYLYLAGGIFDGSAPCSSCATNCNAGGQSCANSNPNGCTWWGCWQYDQVSPGDYLRVFLNNAQTNNQIPMVTYYEILQASGASEGAPVVAAANNSSFMSRYFADWRFLLQQIGQRTALLHIEPDFWGFAQQVNANPQAIPAAVASANATDCSSQANNIGGMARCMIAMTRKYAPNARVGLHASAWGTGIDVHLNSNSSFNIAGEAQKLGGFLRACGADTGDFVVVEASDRDAGYYTSIGQNRWWDATNATLPNFNQAFTWAKALAEDVRRPLVWWQLPLGNMSLPNGNNAWRDNRLDYFFSHTQQIVTAHGAVIAFGAGAGGQTTPESDGGNFISKVNAYKQAGGQIPCP